MAKSQSPQQQPQRQTWTFHIRNMDGSFHLTIKESMLRRMDYGASSTYVSQELTHLAMGTVIAKFYNDQPADTYQLAAVLDGHEDEEPLVQTFVGPTAPPDLRKVRYLAVYIPPKEGEAGTYGVCGYDDETMAFALPSGKTLYAWKLSFRRQLEMAMKAKAYRQDWGAAPRPAPPNFL